ncbi:MAG: wax ester/triacylglycerol synthase family O-acyltransferase [Candidatus Nanopelagicales bacterium]
MSPSRMSPVDHAWYRMDSPDNLMMVHAIMWTGKPLDWDLLRGEVADRMLEQFPKFRQHPVPASIPFTRAAWQDDPEFDLERHVVQHRLPAPGDQRTLEDYISSQIPLPLDPQHPMWQVHFIDGYAGGSAVLYRMHHSIADGITLNQVLLSLTNARAASGFVASQSRGVLTQAADLARGIASQSVQTVRRPARLVSATTSTVRGARRLVHLATIPAKPRSALSGDIGPTKRVTWTTAWRLPQLKAISRSAGVTVNDVLLSVLADALGRYLTEQGTPLDHVRVMVPVNLRALDRPLINDLGNVFGEYVVTLPTGPMTPSARLARMNQIIRELKDSPEAVVAYLTLVAIGYLPEQIEDLSTRLFSGKIVATVSNVPGPTTQVRLAGTPVSGIIGWVPAAGNVGLGVSMFSYADRVVIGLITDTTLIPDAQRLVDLLHAALVDLES